MLLLGDQIPFIWEVTSNVALTTVKGSIGELFWIPSEAILNTVATTLAGAVSAQLTCLHFYFSFLPF